MNDFEIKDNRICTHQYELLYGYLQMLISMNIFHQIINFSGEIIAYQELFWMVKLLMSSAQPQQQQKREKQKSNRFNKQNKNSEWAAHFLADFFAVIVWLTWT